MEKKGQKKLKMFYLKSHTYFCTNYFTISYAISSCQYIQTECQKYYVTQYMSLMKYNVFNPKLVLVFI